MSMFDSLIITLLQITKSSVVDPAIKVEDNEKAVERKRKASAIHFKFNQGFSNAVRRSVSIHDFL